MKVLVISDTHGRDENLDRVWENVKPVDYILHCGDVGGRAEYIRRKTPGPCCIVAGNCDYAGDLPPSAEFDIGGHHLFMTHGHRQGVNMSYDGILLAARLHEADLVCFGHTHIPELSWHDGILLCNPGSLTYPRQMSHKPSYILLDITPENMTGKIFEIN